MKHALTFAKRYPGWHTWDTRCRATIGAIRRLEKRGLIETNKHGQFKRI